MDLQNLAESPNNLTGVGWDASYERHGGYLNIVGEGVNYWILLAIFTFWVVWLKSSGFICSAGIFNLYRSSLDWSQGRFWHSQQWWGSRLRYEISMISVVSMPYMRTLWVLSIPIPFVWPLYLVHDYECLQNLPQFASFLSAHVFAPLQWSPHVCY